MIQEYKRQDTIVAGRGFEKFPAHALTLFTWAAGNRQDGYIGCYCSQATSLSAALPNQVPFVEHQINGNELKTIPVRSTSRARTHAVV